MTRSIPLSRTRMQTVSLSDMLHGIWPVRPARRRVVDVRELPDHLKRDLGLLDGSRPVGGVRW